MRRALSLLALLAPLGAASAGYVFVRGQCTEAGAGFSCVVCQSSTCPTGGPMTEGTCSSWSPYSLEQLLALQVLDAGCLGGTFTCVKDGCGVGRECIFDRQWSGTEWYLSGTHCEDADQCVPVHEEGLAGYSYVCGGVSDAGPGGLHDDPPSNDEALRSRHRRKRGPLPDLCTTGGARSAGDPISIANGYTRFDWTDITLPSGSGSLDFIRTFHASPTDWLAGGPLVGALVPTPFGTAPDTGANGAFPGTSQSLLWTHNLYSFIYQRVVDGTTTWVARLPSGDMIEFTACITAPCVAYPAGTSAESGARLVLTQASPRKFLFVHESGRRYAYEAAWGSGSQERTFLSRIEGAGFLPDGGAAETQARLSYAVPAGCAAGVPTESMATGAPFLLEAETHEGVKLRFRYVTKQAPPSPVGVQAQCVLQGVDLGVGGPTLLTFDYRQDKAGLLLDVVDLQRPQAGSGSAAVQSYRYFADVGEFQVFEGNPAAGAEAALLRHVPVVALAPDAVKPFVGTTHVGVAGQAQLELKRVFRQQVPCPPNTSCIPSSAVRHVVTEQNRHTGDGSGSLPSDVFAVAFELARQSYAAGRRTMAIDAGAAFQQYTVATPAGARPYNSVVANSRGSTVTTASATTDSRFAGAPVKPLEVTAVARGSESTSYGYGYGAPTGSLTPIQLSTSTGQASVLGAGNATTRRYYDSGTNRLRAVIREGYTLTFSPASGWSTPQLKYQGTFYFDHQLPSGTPDPFARTLETHGPCWTTSGALDCSGSVYPITRYEYFDDTAAPANRRRLKKTIRYPAGLNSTPLVHEVLAYDGRGNVLQEQDERSTVWTYTYEADQRTSATSAGGGTWSYAYDQGELYRVTRPSGLQEVFCHRSSPSLAAGCTLTNTPSTEVTARFLYANGNSGPNFVEATLYTYAPDGKLRTEQLYAGPGGSATLFRKRTVERNPAGFETYEKEGTLGAYNVDRTTRRFDPDGLVSAIGPRFNAAPDFCGTGAVPDAKCARFDYAANTGRLLTARQPTSGGAFLRTDFTYDPAGNVATRWSNNASSQTSTYQYDDFGNVVRAAVVNTENAAGTGPGLTRYEYDALGDVQLKQTEEMAATGSWQTWTLDQLGRPTEMRVLTASTNTLVLSWMYDTAATQPSGCSFPNANAAGQVSWTRDAVWERWRSYDALGRVVAESRAPAGAPTCTSTNWMRTNYEYTADGQLAAIDYPHGRRVEYVYSATALVARVRMSVWNGSQSSVQDILTDFRWHPGGVLAGYVFNAYSEAPWLQAPDAVRVSYLYGATGADPTAVPSPANSCATLAVPGAQGGDASGRLRGVWVSKGSTTDTGDVMKVVYRWKADQLMASYRCYGTMGTTPPMREEYKSWSSVDGYDLAGRLTEVTEPDFLSSGGWGWQHSFTFDAHGRRNREYTDSTNYYQSVYANDGHLFERLSRQDAYPSFSALTTNYVYDRDGRVTKRYSPADSVVAHVNQQEFPYAAAPGASAPTPGLDSVMKGVRFGDTGEPSVVLMYYYDEQNRRVRKEYPSTFINHFLYGEGKRLLADDYQAFQRGVDEYIYLGDVPVVMMRSGYAADGTTKLADWSTGSCLGSTGWAACSPHLLVHDYLPKPVLAVDSKRRIEGVGEYTPFGAINRAEWWGQRSPEPTKDDVSELFSGILVPKNGLQLELRGHFPRWDIRSTAAVGIRDETGTWLDYAWGRHPGFGGMGYWTLWVPLTTPTFRVDFYSYTYGSPSPTPQGIGFDGYEYRRFESGATAYFPPLRFPGQYADVETGLFENWNRYYDPASGRYLSPEPLLQQPQYVRGQAQRGLGVPAYAYANNNPLYWTDPTGLSYCSRNAEDCRRNAEQLLRQQCLCSRLGGTWSLVADVRGGGDIVGGKCDIRTTMQCPGGETGWSSNLPTNRVVLEAATLVLSCDDVGP